MHIVIVSDYANRGGGAEKVAVDSAIGLARAGEDVHFLSGGGPVDPELEAAGVTLHLAGVQDLKHKTTSDLFLSGLWSRKCAALASELLARLPRGQSVVHVHGWQRALTTATLRACRDSAHPMIMTLHEFGTACPNQGFFDYQRGEICTRKALGAACLATHCDTRTYAHKLWRAGRTALQRIGAAVPTELDDVIYVSDLSRELLAPYFGPATNWHAVRNPISVGQGERICAEQNDTFLFVGRVTPEKGVGLLASAATSAGVRAAVVGDGPALEELRREYPGLRYLGWQDGEGVRQAMRQARALVFPSRWYEVQGLVVQEAQARGLPVIVADRTAARESVKDGVTGLLFRHMDAADLALQMRRLSADDELTARLSTNAYEQFWRDPPTLERHVAALQDVYRSCLAATSRRPRTPRKAS